MKKYLIAIAILGFISGFTYTVKANPVFLPPTTQTATATSTQVQVHPTVAAATLLYDAYQVGNPTAAEGAALLIQATASSAPSTINITFQYSQDGVDYYGDGYKFGTTTNPINVSTVKSIFWNPGTTATSSRIVDFYTPTRYTKVSVTGTVATTSVWMQIVPQKQQKE